MAEKFVEVRCENCKRLLFEADITKGKVRKICPRCKKVNIFSVPKERTEDKA